VRVQFEMEAEHRKGAVLDVPLLRSAGLRSKCAAQNSLALAELDLANLSCLTGSPNNSLLATVGLADRLLEVLATLNSGNNTRLLDFAVKPAQ
jgi:hypothetical protein